MLDLSCDEALNRFKCVIPENLIYSPLLTLFHLCNIVFLLGSMNNILFCVSFVSDD
jgi:hypothetical protein